MILKNELTEIIYEKLSDIISSFRFNNFTVSSLKSIHNPYTPKAVPIGMLNNDIQDIISPVIRLQDFFINNPIPVTNPKVIVIINNIIRVIIIISITLLLFVNID